MVRRVLVVDVRLDITFVLCYFPMLHLVCSIHSAIYYRCSYFRYLLLYNLFLTLSILPISPPSHRQPSPFH